MDSKDKLAEILESEKKNFSDTVDNTRIRTSEDINLEIQELNNYYNSRHNIIKKYLIHQDMKLNLGLWIAFSLFFYVLAFIAYFFGPDRNLNSFFTLNTSGLAYVLMPLYLFICLFTLSALTYAIRRAVLTVPKIMSIPLDNYEKTIKRFESNLAPLILATPFILYNLVGIVKDLENNTYFSLIPTVVLFVSWVVEWVLFGNILWLMIYYIIYIRQITKKYHYDSELLSVVLKDEIKPIVHVGYEQSIVLAFFLIINIIYIIYKGFYITDFIASFLIFLLIPIISIVPLNMVHKDLSKEIERFRKKSLDRITLITKGLFVNQDIPVDDKIDFILTDRILYRLRQVHKSHKNYTVYFRILGAMIVPLAGYYVDYGQQITDSINKTFNISLPFIHLLHLLL